MYVYTLFIGLPFSKAIQESIKGEFIARLNAFIVDVKAKADAHKEKVVMHVYTYIHTYTHTHTHTHTYNAYIYIIHTYI